MSPEIVVGDLPGLRGRLAREFDDAARAAIAARGRLVVALPGGSVAEAFFAALAEAPVDWSSTDFFWIDERAVPPGDPDSNYGLASRLWLTPAGVPAARIHRMAGDERDLALAARRASEELTAVAGDPPRLDVVLVGVGEDGHVASIFPGREVLTPGAVGLPSAHEAPVEAVYDAPKPPPRRLTMTLPVLLAARRVVVAALGRAKAQAIRDALHASDAVTPLAHLLRTARAPLVLLDRDAADLLPT